MSEHFFPDVTFRPIGRDELNACLTAWATRWASFAAPTGWAHGLGHDNELVAVVSADTLIRPRVAGLSHREAVELSRLCAARPDLCRVALRLGRSFVFPVLACERGYRWAVSDQDAALHSGNLYRFAAGSVSADRAAAWIREPAGRPATR